MEVQHFILIIAGILAAGKLRLLPKTGKSFALAPAKPSPLPSKLRRK